jgi:hypothetical protein
MPAPPIAHVIKFLQDVREEYEHATRKYGGFNSAHEGYAVILEELDELWEEVRRKRANRDHKNMYRESVQIAAMALKFALTVALKQPKE